MRAFAREEELEGLVGTVGQTFLGLTVNCSRCHDHKFDPITQKEFYQISAALGGTYQGDERESLSGRRRGRRREADRRAAGAKSTSWRTEKRPTTAEARSRREALAAGKRRAAARRRAGAHDRAASSRAPGASWPAATSASRARSCRPRGIAAVTGVSPDWESGRGRARGRAPQGAGRVDRRSATTR